MVEPECETSFFSFNVRAGAVGNALGQQHHLLRFLYSGDLSL